MGYILLGVLGFVAGYGFELASVKGKASLKPLLAAAAAGLLTYSTVMVCLQSERFWLPPWLQALGWVLLPISASLLVYSLFLELPFSSTYRYRKGGLRPRLVTTGTYALVRHPSVPWYVLGLAALLLVTRSQLLLVALPLWVFLDVAWVVLQERVLLSRVFSEYGSYRQTTPMLIPTFRSVAECLRTLRSPSGQTIQGRW